MFCFQFSFCLLLLAVPSKAIVRPSRALPCLLVVRFFPPLTTAAELFSVPTRFVGPRTVAELPPATLASAGLVIVAPWSPTTRAFVRHAIARRSCSITSACVTRLIARQSCSVTRACVVKFRIDQLALFKSASVADCSASLLFLSSAILAIFSRRSA
ncbi:MAG: hypothetical protein RIQ81_245 [Pseudomonadota bacterium]